MITDMATDIYKNTNTKYDLVIIGNYTKDTIVSRSGVRKSDGSGFLYSSYAAALTGVSIAGLTRLAKEDAYIIDDLKKIGVDVIPTFTPHSTLMKVVYPTSNVDERTVSVEQDAGPYDSNQVHQIGGLNAKIFLINAMMRGEVGMDVIREIKKKNALVALDVQGFMRVVTGDGSLKNDNWIDNGSVLSQIDIIKTDAVEAEILTGERDIRKAAAKISESGPKEVVLTHRNGLLVYAFGTYYEAEFFPKALTGRTGRGDTCIGSYIAKRLTASPKEAMIWAAAATSLKLETEGPIRRTAGEIGELIDKKYVASVDSKN